MVDPEISAISWDMYITTGLEDHHGQLKRMFCLHNGTVETLCMCGRGSWRFFLFYVYLVWRAHGRTALQSQAYNVRKDCPRVPEKQLQEL
jgi:hypothetical protein